MKKTFLIDTDERLTDSVKIALSQTLQELGESQKVKAFELFELPTDEPKPILALGEVP